MKLEDFEKITDAICEAMNSTKLLRICIMRLSELKETTSHGLRWNNSLVSPVFFFCSGMVFVYSVLACRTDQLHFQEKHMVNIIEKQ